MPQSASRPLGIIAALADESAGLIAEMIAEGAAETVHLGRRDYHAGQLWGRPAVITLARVGKVAAATTATAMIHHFGVEAIVFTGVAGALAPHIRVGDIIVADHLMQHDLDASPLFPRYEVPLLGLARFAGDAALSAALADAAAAFLARATAELTPQARAAFGLDAPAVHRGLIVSGDRFVNGGPAMAALRSAVPDALATEMEGAAVAQVCHEYGVACAVMRTVSDAADDNAHVDFVRFLREVASVYSYGVIRRLLQPN
jgi:adenosylhomocysteine nucleosidase